MGVAANVFWDREMQVLRHIINVDSLVSGEDNDYGQTCAFWSLNEQLLQLDLSVVLLFFFRIDLGLGK